MRYLKNLGTLVAPLLVLASVAVAAPAQARDKSPVCVDSSTQQVVACPQSVVDSSSTRSNNRRNNDKVGKGDYFTYKSPKIMPNGDVIVQRVTTGEGELMIKLDDICRVEAKRQNPSAFKTIFLVALRNAPGAFIGGALGASVGGFTGKGGPSALQYGAYNGIATVGGSIGAGINAYEMGKHNNVAGCMMGLMTDAHRQGYLRNINITYNTFPVYGKPLRLSDMPVAPLTERVEDAGGDTDSDNVAAPPR